MINFLKRMDEYWANVEKVAITVALIVMGIVVFIQVVLRYVFNAGIPWAEELARYLMIWAGFLGGSLATRERRHIMIDIIPKVLPRESIAGAILIKLSYLIASGFCFFLFYVGLSFVSISKGFGRESQSMHIPMWIVQSIIPLSALFMGLRFFALIFSAEAKAATEDLDSLAEQSRRKAGEVE